MAATNGKRLNEYSPILATDILVELYSVMPVYGG